MKTTAIIMCLAILAFVPTSVSADDFGERFYNNAPSSLGDFTSSGAEAFPDIAMDDAAQDLQEIMPAAGEEVVPEDVVEIIEE